MSLKNHFWLPIAGLLFALPTAVLAESACLRGEAVSADTLVHASQQACCGQGRRSNTCFRNAIRGYRKNRTVLGSTVVNPTVRRLRAVRASGCSSAEQLNPASCGGSSVVSLQESIAAIEGASCSKRFQSRRLSSLNTTRKNLRRSRRFLPENFSTSLFEAIGTLRRARTCGEGGETGGTPDCRKIEDPRDGPVLGNVYKIGDYTGTPVFLTHNGARSGQALTPSGRLIENLRYTGLANPDPRGPRHHYRLSSSCRSLPIGMLLKIGGTCYEIDSPCSRID